MGLRFIRQPSETPNVGNTDDARMIRYAYGGQDGFIQKAGNELSYNIIGNVFRINSGVIVLQGWESEIDSNGWMMTVDNVATQRYYSVYYEVNLATQTTSIKSEYGIAEYPEIDAGDDLTAIQTGTAKLLLYQFTARSGTISDVSKKVTRILYATLTSNRPPITSVNVVGTGLSLGSSGNNAGTHVKGFDVRVDMPPSSEINAWKRFITYLPNDSANSIASVEFTYSRSDILEYQVQADGSFYAIALRRLVDKLTAEDDRWETISNFNVQATITDLYGNKFTVDWEFPEFTAWKV